MDITRILSTGKSRDPDRLVAILEGTPVAVVGLNVDGELSQFRGLVVLCLEALALDLERRFEPVSFTPVDISRPAELFTDTSGLIGKHHDPAIPANLRKITGTHGTHVIGRLDRRPGPEFGRGRTATATTGHGLEIEVITLLDRCHTVAVASMGGIDEALYLGVDASFERAP